MGAKPQPSYNRICVISNCVIMRLQCNYINNNNIDNNTPRYGGGNSATAEEVHQIPASLP